MLRFHLSARVPLDSLCLRVSLMGLGHPAKILAKAFVPLIIRLSRTCQDLQSPQHFRVILLGGSGSAWCFIRS